MKAVFALLCLAIVVAAQSCQPSPFGAATGFNLFVLSSTSVLDGCNSDVEGAVAGAGPINLLNYLVGNKIGNSYPYPYALVAGGAITFENGGVMGGGILGNSVTGVQKVEIRDGGNVYYAPCCTDAACSACVASASFINFGAAKTSLLALSDTFSSYDTSAGAQIVDRYGNIDLYCGSESFTIFNDITIDSTHRQLQIHCSAAQTVLINYTPQTAGFPTGMSVNLLEGITAGTVIHHFTNLFVTITTEVEGALFAPRSCLAFPTGLITGDVIVDIYDTPGSCNGGQINNAPFCGCIPGGSDTNYCCSYSRNSSTRTYCSSLPCSFQSLPQWSFESQVETDDCEECCWSEIN